MIFYPFLYKSISYRQMDAVHSDYKEQIGASKFTNHNNLNVLDNLEFENLIDNRYYNSNDQLKVYFELINELEVLNKLIEKAIENHFVGK